MDSFCKPDHFDFCLCMELAMTTATHPTLWNYEIESLIDATVAINRARENAEAVRQIIEYFCQNHEDDRPYLENLCRNIAAAA